MGLEKLAGLIDAGAAQYGQRMLSGAGFDRVAELRQVAADLAKTPASDPEAASLLVKFKGTVQALEQRAKTAPLKENEQRFVDAARKRISELEAGPTGKATAGTTGSTWGPPAGQKTKDEFVAGSARGDGFTAFQGMEVASMAPGPQAPFINAYLAVVHTLELVGGHPEASVLNVLGDAAGIFTAGAGKAAAVTALKGGAKLTDAVQDGEKVADVAGEVLKQGSELADEGVDAVKNAATSNADEAAGGAAQSSGLAKPPAAQLGDAAAALKQQLDDAYQAVARAKVDVAGMSPEKLVEHRAQLGQDLDNVLGQIEQYKSAFNKALDADPKAANGLGQQLAALQDRADEIKATLTKGVETAAAELNKGLLATAKNVSADVLQTLPKVPKMSLGEIDAAIDRLEGLKKTLSEPDRGAKSVGAVFDAVHHATDDIERALTMLKNARPQALAKAEAAGGKEAAMKAASEQFKAAEAAKAALALAVREAQLAAKAPVKALTDSVKRTVGDADQAIRNLSNQLDPTTTPAKILGTARAELTRAQQKLEAQLAQLGKDKPADVAKALESELNAAKIELQRASNAVGDLEVGAGLQRTVPSVPVPKPPREPITEGTAEKLLRDMPAAARAKLVDSMGRVQRAPTALDYMLAYNAGLL